MNSASEPTIKQIIEQASILGLPLNESEAILFLEKRKKAKIKIPWKTNLTQWRNNAKELRIGTYRVIDWHNHRAEHNEINSSKDWQHALNKKIEW